MSEPFDFSFMSPYNLSDKAENLRFHGRKSFGRCSDYQAAQSTRYCVFIPFRNYSSFGYFNKNDHPRLYFNVCGLLLRIYSEYRCFRNSYNLRRLRCFALLLLKPHLCQFFRKLLVGEIGNIGVEVEVFGFDFGLILPTEIVLEVEN